VAAQGGRGRPPGTAPAGLVRPVRPAWPLPAGPVRPVPVRARPGRRPPPRVAPTHLPAAGSARTAEVKAWPRAA
jgi:hypothetical protein